ncbi:MAG: deoxyribose-phosphate aldolase [Ignavibacteria bacterium CG_4_8_14_3_um_filter_37_9]|nr:MAG: deoxyribose-phosphate aldolase [Ignavibacteria bacterium CG08_land_8_20_14_0_20_37_9]PIW98099.1 MAG: deoxyribose-phosphate aldolase [Ignavibacteria bacterium CG_4_8_14_3_um_filter_37_9]PIX94106.1 MAG: deoxyribose-phosphate aldolase [Ignavibacteria bacterium CG_4_10_14_3_um_filter_37_18]
MDSSKVERIVSQVFLEKSLRDFYCQGDTCKGWETNVITQPNAIKNIVNVGAERITAGLGVGDHLPDLSLARMIDHTMLKPDATNDEITKLCSEAKQYHFASVCVNPGFVPLCSSLLKGTDVKVCTVIGFPLGATTTEVKRLEAEQAIASGAVEIDMVINVGQLKSGNYDYVFNDVNKVVTAVKAHRNVCKVILETALLTDEEKVKACLICKKAGADFVKTSTGFSKGGATVGDVALMKKVVGSAIGVKASGGIRSKEDAEAMIASGADRIGASASVKIVMGEKSESSY